MKQPSVSLNIGKSHQELFSCGIVFRKSLIAAPLARFPKSVFDKMTVVFIGETT